MLPLNRRPAGIAVLSALILGCLVATSLVGPVAALSNDSPTLPTEDSHANGSVACGSEEIRVYGLALFYAIPESDNHRYDDFYHPMRNIEMELKGVSAGPDNETLVSTETDRQGQFEVCVAESELSGGRDMYVKFRATNPAAYVRNGSPFDGGNIYAGRSEVQTVYASLAPINLSPSPPDIHAEGFPADPPPALAPQSNNTGFHIADSMYEAREFFRNQGETNWTPKQVQVFFPEPRTAYYSAPDGGSIDLEPRSDDQQDIWHEYGHALMTAAYEYVPGRDPSTYGPRFNLSNSCHSYTSESNYGFAMSEGWAEYTSGLLGDNWNDSRSYHSIETGVCPPFGDAGQYDGYRVEGSVASVLYNLTAEANPNNPAAVEFDELFEVFRTEYPKSIFEVHEHLRPKTSDPERFDEIFLDHGIDVVPPELRVTGNETRVIEDPVIQFGGTASDQHVNMSRVQFRVLNRVDDGRVTGPDSWQTMTGPNETQWAASFFTGAERVDVQIRASDRFGNNATRTITYYREGEIPTIDEQMVRDPDADGAYEDIDANGNVTRQDVLTYYDHRESSIIKGDNPQFDYNGDGTAGTVADALTLYEESEEN
jgi:hypothetical protein